MRGEGVVLLLLVVGDLVDGGIFGSKLSLVVDEIE